MTTKRKILSLGLILGLVGGVYVGAKVIPDLQSGKAPHGKDTLYLWYTDAALTDYLTNMSTSYYEEHGVPVLPVLKDGLEYTESIYRASISEDQDAEPAPDLFITTNDNLEKAYLSGIAAEIVNDTGTVSDKNYPQTALDAVTYKGKTVGYPFYYETSVFLYNKTFLDESGQKVPANLQELLEFADNYDPPETVETIFSWDVSDIFYNYYFSGNYMIVGGDTGDDPTKLDIDNKKTRACLEMYQQLNQFFSIDTKEVDYDSVVQDFIDGKIVMTVATSDVLAKLEAAKADGSFAYEYATAAMPDLSTELKGRSLSVTDAIVVNGFSDKTGKTNDFANYLSYSKAQELYDASGKLASRKGLSYANPAVQGFENEYARSISMPKLLGAGNFWVQLEICFSKIWNGQEVEPLLKELAKSMQEQL
ncbi:MAG: extracellular solute-binding protein [Lachnospiraceae bacterium]|nr:extracellular solute-binding protein [Lachnospiraceae bacterium]